MPIIEFATASELLEMIEAGNTQVAGMTMEEAAIALGATESSNIIYYTSASSTGGNVIQITEGTASGVYQAAAGDGIVSSSGAISTGPTKVANLSTASKAGTTGVVGILTIALPTWVAMAAPLIGVKIGADLYQSNPELWTEISQRLAPWAWDYADLMIGAVDADGQVYIDDEAIKELDRLFKEKNIGREGYQSSLDTYPMIQPISASDSITGVYSDGRVTTATASPYEHITGYGCNQGDLYYIKTSKTKQVGSTSYTYQGKTVYYSAGRTGIFPYPSDVKYTSPINYTYERVEPREKGELAWTVEYGTPTGGFPEGTSEWDGDVVDYTEGQIQVGKTLGGEVVPYDKVALPNIGDPPGTSIDPEVKPNPQTPSTEPEIEPFISPEVQPNKFPSEVKAPDSATETAPLPNPNPKTDTEIDPDLDPSRQPESDPEPAPTIPETPPTSTGDSPDIIFPIAPIDFPSIVTSGSGLIHVYNPTPEEMISFGQWLWVTYADPDIQKIWNNPFDGVISAHELYATPYTEGRDNIRSGFLVCPTSADLVPVRYTTINCGSIAIPEYYANYLDYSPYSKAYIYLPFIGIVEVDVDDIVGHGVNITYHVDSYNGSCIAQITVAKQDYSNTVYQFSGNCAVELPLAGGSQAAIRAGLISAAATGLSSAVGGIASILGGNIGGGISGIAYGLGGAVSHAVSQKSTVQHSGTFGASYGAMGIKKPYIIIRRPIEKEVDNYNVEYGFPAHKRVKIGDCEGYLRVREVHVVSPTATDEEKVKIEEMLKEGVFVT